METVQLQCGHCKKVMGVSAAHLGQQVRCPHCSQVVQTPAPSPPPETDTLMLPADAAPSPPVPHNDDVTAAVSESLAPMPTTPAFENNAIAMEAAPGQQAEFSQFKPKTRRDRGVLLVIALIFLVPYAAT